MRGPFIKVKELAMRCNVVLMNHEPSVRDGDAAEPTHCRCSPSARKPTLYILAAFVESVSEQRMLTINPILKLSLIQSIECIRIAVCILSQRYLEAFDSVAVPCSNHDTVGLCSDSCLHYRRYSLKFASHTVSFIHRWPRSISVLSSVQWLLLHV